MNLNDCFTLFTQKETLDDDNKPVSYAIPISTSYRIAGYFRGVQFSLIAAIKEIRWYNFRGFEQCNYSTYGGILIRGFNFRGFHCNHEIRENWTPRK